MNKWTHLDKYAMPLLEKFFDGLNKVKGFNTLDLRSNYHQLPFKEGDKGQDDILGD
jgi:hypothetical protein